LREKLPWAEIELAQKTENLQILHAESNAKNWFGGQGKSV